MKVAWLQDLPLASGGGAQNTDLMHFREGIRRGHEVEEIIGQFIGGVVPQGFDLYIVSNCVTFKVEELQKLATEGRSYAMFFHDYTCKWRLFYPMQPKCQRCYLRDRWLPVHLKARLLVWLSPLHRDAWLYMYPELANRPYALVPSPVDAKQFRPLGKERQGIVIVNGMLPFKGKENVEAWIKEHPDESYTIVGGLDLEREDHLFPRRIRFMGHVAHEKMNEVLNEHEFYLHLPQTPQPFERATAEAFLAGCKLIVNPLVGALSYDWFRSREEVAEHCGNAPKLFWDSVEAEL